MGMGSRKKNLNHNSHYPILSPLQVRNISNDLSRPLRVYFCGHSLGAALTVLAALDLAVNLNYILDAMEVVYGDGEDNTCDTKTRIKEKSNLNDNSNQESSKISVKKPFPNGNIHPQHTNTSTPSSKSKKKAHQSSEINSVELSSFYPGKEDVKGSILGTGQGSGRDANSAQKMNAENRKVSKWESPTIAVYTYGGTYVIASSE